MKTSLADIKPYTTKDGSVIRELMHPDRQGNKNQSLAEATVAPGAQTRLHRHHCSEELYHITRGDGLLTLDEKLIEVSSGDTILIPPGTAHRIKNRGNGPLTILCCCSPPYAHDDTELLE